MGKLNSTSSTRGFSMNITPKPISATYPFLSPSLVEVGGMIITCSNFLRRISEYKFHINQVQATLLTGITVDLNEVSMFCYSNLPWLWFLKGISPVVILKIAAQVTRYSDQNQQLSSKIQQDM